MEKLFHHAYCQRGIETRNIYHVRAVRGYTVGSNAQENKEDCMKWNENLIVSGGRNPQE